MPRTSTFLTVALALILISQLHAADPIPDDFPRFIVPGQEKPMESLRSLYYLHYIPGGPLATLWDEWLSGSTLWPAMTTENRMDSIRARWSDALSARHIDPEGYVATHQHPSIAHQDGWPFPSYEQGLPLSWGWHFAVPSIPYAAGGIKARKPDGWVLEGGTDKGIDAQAWNIELTSPSATLRTPDIKFQADNSPFIQIRWRSTGIENAQPYLEWIKEGQKDATPNQRMYFDPLPSGEAVAATMIPVFKSPEWNGNITRLRLHFDNPAGAKVGLQAVFTQYDTRHNINNQNFIRGCCQYFWWTRDLNFLRRNIQRMRLAQLYTMRDLGGLKEKCIVTPFPGHDGRAGWTVGTDGKKKMRPGGSIGSDYWDLLPMGKKDTYATIHYFDMLNNMANLEKEIESHPEWDIPAGPLVVASEEILSHAREVKDFASQLFWNKTEGRFYPGIDADGVAHDFGLTFLNLEAVAYDFAAPEQAESIMQWMNGERVVSGDTSQGADIYHWRFAPRATTKRNVEWYFWGWTNPESIPFGDQVQDGGAVLGFSYHDLLARLNARGPDNAWARLKEITSWFDEVQAAGGYRAYYKDGSRGTLQGGNKPGGLGLDQEFFESILVPQIMLNGFLGFKPTADGFSINPRLPKDWPELTITRIHLHRHVLDIRVSGSTISVSGSGSSNEILKVVYPADKWRIESQAPVNIHGFPEAKR